VNNLGVGLHSYGFTEGVWRSLFLSWAFLGLFMAMGVVLWFKDRAAKSLRRESSPAGAGATA
jgi:Na+/H+ antiporter NhaC